MMDRVADRDAVLSPVGMEGLFLRQCHRSNSARQAAAVRAILPGCQIGDCQRGIHAGRLAQHPLIGTTGRRPSQLTTGRHDGGQPERGQRLRGRGSGRHRSRSATAASTAMVLR